MNNECDGGVRYLDFKIDGMRKLPYDKTKKYHIIVVDYDPSTIVVIKNDLRILERLARHVSEKNIELSDREKKLLKSLGGKIVETMKHFNIDDFSIIEASGPQAGFEIIDMIVNTDYHIDILITEIPIGSFYVDKNNSTKYVDGIDVLCELYRTRPNTKRVIYTIYDYSSYGRESVRYRKRFGSEPWFEEFDMVAVRKSEDMMHRRVALARAIASCIEKSENTHD